MMKSTDFSKEEMAIIIDALMVHYCDMRHLPETFYDYDADEVQELMNKIVRTIG